MQNLKKRLLGHLERPSTGFLGFLVRQDLKRNRSTEECTYQALDASPTHDVLEIGFGYGHGLAYALENGLRQGSGKLYGVDHSTTACDAVRKQLGKDVTTAKLTLFNESVSDMSLEDSTIDRVFHTNCYYFWQDQPSCCREILRVMKPGGQMSTGLVLSLMKLSDEKGFVSSERSDPNKYMNSLKQVGFENVSMTEVKHECGTIVHIISATKPE